MTDVETETPAEEVKEEEPRQPCLCGCGGVPTRKRSRFMPGHDAQLKARLYRTIRDGESTEEQKADAAQQLDDFGWPQPAPKRSKAKKSDANGDDEGESTDDPEGEPVDEP